MIINGSFGVLISRIIISDKIEKVSGSTLTCQGLFLSNLGNYPTKCIVVGVEPVTTKFDFVQ